MKIKVCSGSMYENIGIDAAHSDGVYVFDCRLLPDPYSEEGLGKLSGLDPQVVEWFGKRDNVSREMVKGMITLACAAVRQAMEQDEEWGYEAVEFFCGCSGGHHRSPYVAHLIAEAIRREFKEVEVEEQHPCLENNS